jgi:hypothetical protein
MNSHAFDQFNDKFVIENSWDCCIQSCDVREVLPLFFMSKSIFNGYFWRIQTFKSVYIQILTSCQKLNFGSDFGERCSAPVVLSSSSLQEVILSDALFCSSIAFGSATQRSTREEDQDILLLSHQI